MRLENGQGQQKEPLSLKSIITCGPVQINSSFHSLTRLKQKEEIDGYDNRTYLLCWARCHQGKSNYLYLLFLDTDTYTQVKKLLGRCCHISRCWIYLYPQLGEAKAGQLEQKAIQLYLYHNVACWIIQLILQLQPAQLLL